MLSVNRCLRVAGLIGTLFVLGGCPNPKVGFDSPAPSKRLDAIALAAQEDDRESLIELVEKLGSTYPSERMLAIRALEAREGVTLEYDHAAPAWERLEAIERWRERIGVTVEERVGLPDPEGEMGQMPMKEQATGSGG